MTERSFFGILSLCLRSRCPVCGQGRLFVPLARARAFRDLFLPPDRCEACGFEFAREPGYYLGVITPTLSFLALGTGAAAMAIGYAFVGPEIDTILLLGAAGAFSGLFLWFRTAIAVFVSIDHAIDPPNRTLGS